MNKANEIGRQGEAIALHFLACNKHHILDINWRLQKAEIDIISQDKKTLVFLKSKLEVLSVMFNPKSLLVFVKKPL